MTRRFGNVLCAGPDRGLAPVPHHLQSWILPILLPVVLAVCWELSVRFNLVPDTLVASPSSTLRAGIEMLRNGSLLHHCLVSGGRLLIGFAIGAASGAVLGGIVATSRPVSRIVEPTIGVLAPIPPIAWIPLIIILFGIEESSKIALVALGTTFVVLINVVQGIRGTERQFVELAQVLGKGKAALLWWVLIPSALPQAFTGLRIAMALSWTLLLCAEIIASSAGLGWLIWDARNFSRPADLFVGMAAVGVLGRLTDLALCGLERWLTAWRSTYGSTPNANRS